MVKNTFRLLILIIIASIWLPLGMPDDFFIIPIIINAIGFQLYVLLSIILIYVLYTQLEGKTLKDKLRIVKHEIKKFVEGS